MKTIIDQIELHTKRCQSKNEELRLQMTEAILTGDKKAMKAIIIKQEKLLIKAKGLYNLFKIVEACNDSEPIMLN